MILHVRGPGERSHAFDALVDGSLDMVWVHGLVSDSAIATLLGALVGEGSPAYPADHAFAAVRTFGQMIAPTATEPHGPEIGVYQRACAAFRRSVGSALDPFEKAVFDELSALSGSRARIADGYGFASVRRMPEGCGSLVHRDEYPTLPAYARLRELCDLRVQMSWYVQLTLPEEGGALRVFTDDSREEWIDYRPEPGDMLVHAGSVRWHEVQPARGPTPRQTLGGFCAWDADHHAVLSWA